MVLAKDAFRLDGKNVIVTGAAKGLGEAIALAYANFGAAVFICDRDGDNMEIVARRIRDLGANCVTAVLDVRDTNAVNAWVADLPRIDVLVNNAGGTFYSWVLDVNDKGQRSVIDENFTSVTNFIRACVPKMSQGGSIINVTSVEAYRAAPGFGIYGAMKAAVEHISRTLALELSTRNIRVNTLAPDAMHTPGDEALLVGDRDYGATLALGWGSADDIAGAAVFLASSASSFITGTTIHVDGGSDAARGWRKTENGWEP